jgi:hypothetical protein
MPGSLVLFDEWHLQWWLDPTTSIDATELHNRLNAPETIQAIQESLQSVLQQLPALRPLQIQIDR